MAARMQTHVDITERKICDQQETSKEKKCYELSKNQPKKNKKMNLKQRNEIFKR